MICANCGVALWQNPKTTELIHRYTASNKCENGKRAMIMRGGTE